MVCCYTTLTIINFRTFSSIHLVSAWFIFLYLLWSLASPFVIAPLSISISLTHAKSHKHCSPASGIRDFYALVLNVHVCVFSVQYMAVAPALVISYWS